MSARMQEVYTRGLSAELAAGLLLCGMPDEVAARWLVGCVAVLVAGRVVQIWAFTHDESVRWRRSMSSAFGLSIAGWLGLLVLFGLRLLVPELQAPWLLYALALGMHLGGGLWAWRVLGERS